MITHPRGKDLTQGTIFTCATAEDYADCVVHGLVITARCDITNDKAQVFNYVPVVSYEDWVERDGAQIVARRVAAAALASARSILAQIGHAPSILSTTSLRDVLEILFSPDAEKPYRDKRQQFHAACQRWERAEAFQVDSPVEAARALMKSELTEAKRVAKELCQNAIAEAYFLPCVEPEEDCLGYVALLREIRHIPRRLAQAIALGLDVPSYSALCEEDGRLSARLTIRDEQFAWPVGVVASPEIEHLMQRLTLLFARIGVRDVPPQTIRRLQESISREEGAQP